MPITLAANVSGVPDTTEKVTMVQALTKINQLRVDKLPIGTNVEIKASYERILTEALNSIHQTNLAALDFSSLDLNGITTEQKARVAKFMLSALQSGKDPEAVVVAIESAKP